jgi:hypothetical protein
VRREGRVFVRALRHHACYRPECGETRLVLAVLTRTQVEPSTRTVDGAHRCMTSKCKGRWCLFLLCASSIGNRYQLTTALHNNRLFRRACQCTVCFNRFDCLHALRRTHVAETQDARRVNEIMQDHVKTTIVCVHHAPAGCHRPRRARKPHAFDPSEACLPCISAPGKDGERRSCVQILRDNCWLFYHVAIAIALRRSTLAHAMRASELRGTSVICVGKSGTHKELRPVRVGACICHA